MLRYRRIGLILVTLVSLLTGRVAAQDARAVLADRLANNGEVEGVIFRRDGALVFKPRDPNAPAIPIANPDQIPQTALGFDVAVRGTLGDRLQVSGTRLDRPDLGRGRNRSAIPDPILKTTRGIVDELQAKIEGSFAQGAMAPDETRRKLREFILDSEKKRVEALNQCIEARRKNRSGAVRAEIALSVSRIDELGQQAKARYGFTENFPSWTYGKIAANSRSTVAVRHEDAQKPHCSGTLVAPDLVLTAGHCVITSAPKLEVWFDYAESENGSLSPKRLPVLEIAAPEPARQEELIARARDTMNGTYKFDRGFLDYALLRFKSKVGDVEKPADAVPLLLSDRERLPPSRALYVIAYPDEQPVLVHDSARVFLAALATNEERERAACEIEASTAGLSDTDRDAMVDAFVSDYETLAPPTASGLNLVLRDPEVGGQPTLALSADTQGGSSGAPVFDRLLGLSKVEAVFISGAPDPIRIEKAGWGFHEKALPARDILADLQQRQPAIRAELGP
jgi:hypothetical protein